MPRVLFVEDDEISRIAGAALLRSLGVDTDLAVNGADALEMSACWPYTAIFMDCEMPEMDGYTAVTRLHRREGANLHTPVIAVTSRPQWVSLAAGMDHHITKPIEIGELRSDCLRLGLLPSGRAGPSHGSGQPGADVALLDASVFGNDSNGVRNAKARRATDFLQQAILRLPELWRAANIGDPAALHRLALTLKPRAELVGAARVSALCDDMSEAAASSAVARAVDLEEPLRRAIADTRPAVRAWAAGPDVAAAGSVAPGPRCDASSPASAAAFPPGPVRVVLADDEPLVRAGLAAMLDAAPWIDFAGDADDVQTIVDLARRERPDVVLLDWMMPHGGGAEAARRILEGKADTVIVAVTSSDSLEALTEMISAGASCLVSKGGSAAQLTETIARALRTSRSPGAGPDRGRTPAQPVPRHAPVTPVPLTAGPDGDPASSPGSPLDPAVIAQLRTEFGATAILGELVELFGAQTPGRLVELRAGIDGGDAAAVSGHAHQLKGGCLTMGASRMAGLCEELEQSARTGSLAGAQRLAGEIEAEFAQACAALHEQLG